jgi:predicted lipoprotein with Yx(FWY)xxD motif
VCNDKCAAAWTPLYASKDATASGQYSIITRADGTKQWVYKGKPLYTWKNDKKPGDITGNGFLHGTWHVAKP